MSLLKLPPPLHAFLSLFPIHTYPPVSHSTPPSAPTLWIHPPLDPIPAPSAAVQNLLSQDVECLKWQAYLALRGLDNIHVRWDVRPEGALGGRLPNLHVSKSELLPAHLIPGWVLTQLAQNDEDDLEGYKNEAARDESRAWVTLLEGNVHAALILAQPSPSYLLSLLSFSTAASPSQPARSLQTLLTPPPPPLAGITSLFSLLPSTTPRIAPSVIDAQYRDAISSLSERLGTDKWFLGSSNPTPLDAIAFAYLHCILHAKDSIRVEVTRRVNLVAWEWRVRGLVRAAFVAQ